MYLCGNFILSDFCLSLFSFFLILSNIYCSTTNYVLSTFWIFKNSKIKNRLAEFAAFAAVGVVGLGINAAIIWFFKDILASKLIFGTLLPQDKYYLVGKLVSTVIVFIWNFAGRKFIIFDKNKD